MSESPNKLIKFWQELKRRKVFGVVTTYAATAYITIEVANNLAIPLHLPDWFITLILIILIIGLPIVVIMSWIFDFTPKGIKKTESHEESEKEETIAKPVKRRLRPSYILNAILLIAVIVLAYPKIFKQDTLGRLRSSGERIAVAVMPFQNMTNDTLWNVWQDGIQDNLITSLSNSEELKVRQAESINNLVKSQGIVNYASITPSVANKISQKLDANVLIYGSVKQAGSTIRLYAQLIDSETEEVFKSFQIESLNKEENIFHLIDSLSIMVKNFLIISELEKEVPTYSKHLVSTSSPEAYRYFINGNNAFFKKMDYPTAIKLYSQAIAIDSNFYSAMIMLSTTFYNQRQFDHAKKWCLKGYEKRDQMPILQNIHISWLYAMLFETPKEEIKCLNQLSEIDDQNPAIYYELGRIYVALDQYDKAISVMRKTLEIYNNWKSKPRWVQDYIMLGYAYQKTYKYSKEKKLFKKAEKDFPDDLELIYRQAVLALSEGKTKDANNFIDKYISAHKINFVSDADIASSLGDIYWDADILDKAEANFRKALSLEPENPDRLNYFAYFLIDKDRNINEGLKLTDKTLALNSENYNYLHTKGWGLYKQGKFKEALELLEKSWDLRRQYAVYDHEAYLHLEEAKKAVANQKNN
jgi:tetratricopeptide (TPR) repeat protein